MLDKYAQPTKDFVLQSFEKYFKIGYEELRGFYERRNDAKNRNLQGIQPVNGEI